MISDLSRDAGGVVGSLYGEEDPVCIATGNRGLCEIWRG